MKRITILLNEKLTELKNTVSLLKNNIAQFPEGRLNVSFCNKKPRYYHCFKDSGGKSNRVYLKKEEADLASSLARKAYEEIIIKEGEKQISLLTDFLTEYDPDVIYRVYDSLSPARQELIDAGDLDTKEFIRRWQEIKYDPGIFEEGVPEYFTMKKERVRSKTEKIIADRLYSVGIPYRYEFPVRLYNGRIIRPDFMLLDVDSREEYILEHFGRMDDPNYVNYSFIPKMRSYFRSGIYPGGKLLLTFESSTNPFSTKELDMILEYYFGILF